jgi:hypothetical protein
MKDEYLDVIKYFKQEEKNEARKGLYDDVTNHILHGTDIETLAFDKTLTPSVRNLAQQMIRSASCLDIKPREENINRLWLSTIRGLVYDDYYNACRKFIETGDGELYIEEHCRSFRLFWHATIFSNVWRPNDR